VQIIQPLHLGGGEAHGGNSAVVVVQAACIKRVKYVYDLAMEERDW